MVEIELLLEMPAVILLGIAGLSLLIQLGYILFIYGKLAFHKAKEPSEADNPHFPPLSVILCTRNEEHLLRENLESILHQNYPKFEVIVVNDRSEDDTKWYLKELGERFDHLKAVEIAEHVLSTSGKKFGVAMGIKAASHEQVVLIDSDCTPSSENWLKSIGAAFSEQTEIVLGYVPLRRKKGFLNALVRYEHFIKSINYLSFALKKNAFMGLGQNMAFAKDLFFKGKGFASHIHVKSGYDELFVNQHATRSNTCIVIHKDAHVWKPMEKTFDSYIIHRKFRKQATALFKGNHKFVLNLQASTAVLFYLGLVGLVVVQPLSWPVAAGMYAFRLLIQYVIFTPIARKLRITRMLWFLPFLDVLHTFYLGLTIGSKKI